MVTLGLMHDVTWAGSGSTRTRSDRGLFVCFQLLPAATAPRAPLLQLGWRARPAAHVQGVQPMLLSAWLAPTAPLAQPLLQAAQVPSRLQP